MSFAPLLRSRLAVLGMALAALLVIACGSDPTATPAPTATPLPVPTATLAPTATPVPAPTATATPAPTATAIPAPTATPAPAPTATATPAPEPEGMAGGMEPGDSLLPEGATGFIVDANPAALLASSSFLMEMMMDANGIELETFADDFEADTGVDLYSVTYAQMFMPIDALLGMGMGLMGTEEAASADEEVGFELDFGLVLYGEFDEAEVVASLEDSEGAEYGISSYRGYNVYRVEDAGIAFVGSSAMVYGTESSVEAMLDVAAGAAPPASGDAIDALESLGERHLGIVTELPPEFLETLMADGAGLMPEEGLLGALDLSALVSPVNATGLLLSGDGIEIASVSLFDDAAAATASMEYTEGLVAMLGLISTSPELGELASSMEVTQSGNAVTTRMSLSFEMIEQLFDAMGGMDGMGGMGMMPQN